MTEIVGIFGLDVGTAVEAQLPVDPYVQVLANNSYWRISSFIRTAEVRLATAERAAADARFRLSSSVARTNAAQINLNEVREEMADIDPDVARLYAIEPELESMRQARKASLFDEIEYTLADAELAGEQENSDHADAVRATRDKLAKPCRRVAMGIGMLITAGAVALFWPHTQVDHDASSHKAPIAYEHVTEVETIKDDAIAIAAGLVLGGIFGGSIVGIERATEPQLIRERAIKKVEKAKKRQQQSVA